MRLYPPETLSTPQTVLLSLSLFLSFSPFHVHTFRLAWGALFQPRAQLNTHTHIYTYSSINTSKEAEKHKRESFLFS